MRLHRQRTLGLFALLAACAGGAPQGAAGRGTSSSLGAPVPDETSDAPREQTDDQQVLHALNRLGFGPRPGDVARVHAMGVDAWIARQLEPERLADTRADQFGARFVALQGTPGELLDKYPPPALVRRQRAMLEQRMGTDSTPTGDSLRLAVLTALNVADELFRCRDGTRARNGELAERAGELERLLDRVLMA